MKTNKLKIVTILLLIILVTMIAFLGVYSKNNLTMEDQVKDYQYSKEYTGKKVITLETDTAKTEKIKDKDGNEIQSATDDEIAQNGYIKEEVPNNNPDDLNADNYIISKGIINERLEILNKSIKQEYGNNPKLASDKLKGQDYEVRLNEDTGAIVVVLPNDGNADTIASELTAGGKFEIVDTETKEVLLKNEDIKTSEVSAQTYSGQTAIYMSIEFNNEGKKKFEEITRKYVKTEEDTNTDTSEEDDSAENTEKTADTENTENSTSTETNTENSSETKKEKTVTMKIDDTDIMSTGFEEPITDGKMRLTVGKVESDRDSIKKNVYSGQCMTMVLTNKSMPIKYKLTSAVYVQSNYKDSITTIMIIGVAALCVCALLLFVAKYKLNGLLATSAIIGLAAIVLLTIRYWNVILSTEGIVAVFVVLILNIILTNKILNNIKNKDKDKTVKQVINKAIKDMAVKMIPLFILAIFFTFMQKTPAISFGMVMFWGLVLIELYNLIITKNLLNNEGQK